MRSAFHGAGRDALDDVFLAGDVEDDYEGKLYVYKVNTNFDKELAKEYQIAANPTLLFVKNAEVLDRKIGAHTLAELKTWVEALL